jgi:hypothetical protein
MNRYCSSSSGGCVQILTFIRPESRNARRMNRIRNSDPAFCAGVDPRVSHQLQPDPDQLSPLVKSRHFFPRECQKNRASAAAPSTRAGSAANEGRHLTFPSTLNPDRKILGPPEPDLLVKFMLQGLLELCD